MSEPKNNAAPIIENNKFTLDGMIDYLKKLSFNEVVECKRAVEIVYKEKQHQYVQSQLGNVKDLVTAGDIPVEAIAEFFELSSQKRSKRGKSGKSEKSLPKYKEQGTDNTWVGRGPRPDWLKKHLDQGRKLEEFLIDKNDSA